jgi:hypothetical protein
MTTCSITIYMVLRWACARILHLATGRDLKFNIYMQVKMPILICTISVHERRLAIGLAHLRDHDILSYFLLASSFSTIAKVVSSVNPHIIHSPSFPFLKVLCTTTYSTLSFSSSAPTFSSFATIKF